MKSGWVTKKLGEVCEIIMGASPDSKSYNIMRDGLPFYQGKTEFGAEYPTPVKWCSEPVKIAQSGDVLLSVRAPIGPVNFANEKCCIGRGLSALRFEGEQRYLYYFLQASETELDARGTGTTFKCISGQSVRSVPIPIPPLAEQKRIVAKIDAAFEKIDKLKANAERNLANAKELFQSALDEAMRPKDGWVEKRLGEVCKTTSGGTPIKSHREYYEDGNIPWLRSGEVCCKDIIKSEMFITELGLRNSSAKIMPKNTVLIAMYGATAAQAGILRFESATNQAICGILPDKYFEPEFLYYYFRTIQRQLAARAQGGAQPNISQEKIKDTLVPILPLSEQREIVKHLDLLAEKIKILEQNYTKQIADCVEMRQAVLREAFEGRL